jgi:hypothetical protein
MHQLIKIIRLISKLIYYYMVLLVDSVIVLFKNKIEEKIFIFYFSLL